MHSRKAPKLTIASILLGAATVVLLAFAMLISVPPSVEATPALAKGKPCSTCHAGSPPSKSNVKK